MKPIEQVRAKSKLGFHYTHFGIAHSVTSVFHHMIGAQEFESFRQVSINGKGWNFQIDSVMLNPLLHLHDINFATIEYCSVAPEDSKPSFRESIEIRVRFNEKYFVYLEMMLL